MPFLAYIAIVVVGLSTILLELDWLTSPSAANKPTAKIASTAVPPRAPEVVAKVDGPNPQLSPVFPTNPNAPRAEKASAEAAPAAAPVPVAPAPVTTAMAAPTVETKPATTGVAPASEPPPAAPTTQAAQPAASTAQAAPQPAVHASANACNVQACASTYQSFRASDCSYQPMDGGARRACTVPPGASRRIASTPEGKVEPAAVGRLQSRVEVRRRTATDLDDAVRRVKELTEVDGDDDGPPVESRVIMLHRDGPRW